MSIVVGLLPVFFALAVGYAAGRSRLIDNKNVAALNTLVMTIALPIALFTILAGSDRSDVLEHSEVAGVVLLVMSITYLGTFFFERRVWRQGAPAAAIQALTVAFPNTAAIGLPIADAVLGRTGALAVAVSLAVGTITLSPATIVIVERKTASPTASTIRTVGRALRTPVVIAPIAGLAWSLFGLPFPDLLDSTLSEIGSITAGLALFLTGLVLSAQPIRPSINASVSALVGNILRPALASLAVKLFAVPEPMSSEIVLLMAVPSGFFGVLLAIQRGLNPRLAGTTLFYSTGLSIATLSVVILLLPGL
jgi:malonate transporter